MSDKEQNKQDQQDDQDQPKGQGSWARSGYQPHRSGAAEGQ